MSSDFLDPKIASNLMVYLADENTVLVGGQSVMLWAYHYSLVETDQSFTRDIDFYGNSADVEAADLRLIQWGHETRFADLEDASPNSGVILIDVAEGEQVRVDYLWSVQGLAGADIQTRAVSLKVGSTGLVLRVLHPLMCLESKIINLGAFAHKRDASGVSQAAIAVRIALAYVQGMVDAGREREALNAVERLVLIAQYQSASFAYHVFGVDVMQAIPASGLPSAFYQVRLPQIEDRIFVSRESLARRLPAEPTAHNTQRMRF